jgi:hypothetical protein
MPRGNSRCLRTSMLAASCMTCGARIGGHDSEAHTPLDARGLCGHSWYCFQCCVACNVVPATTRNARVEAEVVLG